MDAITLKDISLGLALIVGIMTSSAYLSKNIKTWISLQFDEKIAPVNDSIKDVKETVSRVDMESCKNYLARCLADFDRDKELSETEKERFWENYEHYIKCNGNSYIKHKVEKLISEGKL